MPALAAVRAIEIGIVDVREGGGLKLGAFHRLTLAPAGCGLLLYKSYSLGTGRTLYAVDAAARAFHRHLRTLKKARVADVDRLVRRPRARNDVLPDSGEYQQGHSRLWYCKEVLAAVLIARARPISVNFRLWLLKILGYTLADLGIVLLCS